MKKYSDYDMDLQLDNRKVRLLRMIYIFTAIYPEAKALISLLDLKKECVNGKYQQYIDDKKHIRLIIMGVGSMAAAISVSHICTKYNINNQDMIIHIGTCGIFSTNNYQNNFYICNKIVQAETGKTFYPDILYRHDFLESAILTLPVLYTKDKEKFDKYPNIADCMINVKNILIDMEASGVYQAAIQYVGTERIIILKVVSDNGEPQKVTPEFIHTIFIENGKALVQFLELLCRQQKIEANKLSKFPSFTQMDWIDKVCDDMHCSETMRNKLKHLFHYMDITGIDYHKKIEDMYLDKRLPCKDKREGKKCYEQLEMELL